MKTAVITGAAKNIGKGVASILLDQGYKCVLVDKNADKLHQTAIALGSNCSEYIADIGNLEQVSKFIDWLASENHEITALINNVGYDTGKTLLELEPANIRESNQINLDGPFYLTSLISQKWVKDKAKGNIVFITSTHSKVVRTHPLYSTAKAATEMFMKEISLELAPDIRVNAIAPGVVQETEELVSNDLIPLGFNQQPQDIGEGVSFLLSDKARFITGQTLVIDGGFSNTHTHYWLKNKKL